MRLSRKTLLFILLPLLILGSTGIVVGNAYIKKGEAVLSAQEKKTTPTHTPTPTLLPTPTKVQQINSQKETEQIILSSPTITSTPTSQSASSEEVKSMVNTGISEYFAALQNSKQSDCTGKIQEIEKRYKSKIDELESQKQPYNEQITSIKTKIDATLSECCGGNPYAEAAMVGSIANQISEANRETDRLLDQINYIDSKQNELRQLMLNEERLACGQPLEPFKSSVSQYIQNKLNSLPKQYTITPNGPNGYYIQGNGISCTMIPNGSNGYYVTCN